MPTDSRNLQDLPEKKHNRYAKDTTWISSSAAAGMTDTKSETMKYMPQKSISNAMRNHEFRCHWNQTSQYEAVLEPIMLDVNGMKDDIEKVMTGYTQRVGKRIAHEQRISASSQRNR